MKKILFRKLLVDYMSFFLIALFSTSIVVWVFQAVNFLDIMIEDGRDYLTYINYSLLNFPKILSKLFPFVLFFSLFYVTNKIELNNELIILWNFGTSKIRDPGNHSARSWITKKYKHLKVGFPGSS
mgnify:CR=1 FL=1